MFAMLVGTGDEFHLVFECQGLEYICQNNPGLFGQHASSNDPACGRLICMG